MGSASSLSSSSIFWLSSDLLYFGDSRGDFDRDEASESALP